MLETWFNQSWYGRIPWTWLLLPFMWVYAAVVKRKRHQFEANSGTSAIPTIVVGNITVGGTGKTPVVQSLVRFLQDKGYKVGVISRGYGGSQTQHPHLITASDSASQVGDEPYMLWQSLRVPVVIDPVRVRGIALLCEHDVDVVISDDGLQHYAMPRDLEVCVLDGNRMLGNGRMLPVGPLREPVSRLGQVDYILIGGQQGFQGFMIQPLHWQNLVTGEKVALDQLQIDKDCTAIAGIGNPEKFFTTIQELGIKCGHKAFVDHYAYTQEDAQKLSQQILMTEKDAAKIRPFAHGNMWSLSIEAKLHEEFYDRLEQDVRAMINMRNN